MPHLLYPFICRWTLRLLPFYVFNVNLILVFSEVPIIFISKLLLGSEIPRGTYVPKSLLLSSSCSVEAGALLLTGVRRSVPGSVEAAHVRLSCS